MFIRSQPNVNGLCGSLKNHYIQGGPQKVLLEILGFFSRKYSTCENLFLTKLPKKIFFNESKCNICLNITNSNKVLQKIHLPNFGNIFMGDVLDNPNS